MSDSKSLNTSLVEVMICSRNEGVVIRDLSDLTLQSIFDASRASLNVCLKCPVACNNSRHASSSRFHSLSGIEETGSPAIICIICHQVLRHPSGHGTSLVGKKLLAKSHIAKLNEVMELEVTELTISMVDETPLAILKRHGSRGTSVVSLQSKMIFDV